MYVVILAGGGGTRLWPLSRPDRPKPFLPLLGEETLFQRTVRRVTPLVGPADVFCVADGRYASLVRADEPGVRLVIEPSARNTAAAIALATAAIDRPDDEVMVVLPADQWIDDEPGFRDVLAAAEAELAHGALGVERPLVTLGVRIDWPAIEYGYLRPDPARRQDGRIPAFVLDRFDEKPAPARARELAREPGAAWNAGMFLWQRGAVQDALARYTSLVGPITGALGDPDALREAYAAVPSISIDHAVMEPAAREGRVIMGAMDVGWSDLGSWTSLLAALGLPPIEARVLGPGDSARVTSDDLAVSDRDGSLLAEPAGDGTITVSETTAVLKGARPFQAQVDALLARCSGALPA